MIVIVPFELNSPFFLHLEYPKSLFCSTMSMHFFITKIYNILCCQFILAVAGISSNILCLEFFYCGIFLLLVLHTVLCNACVVCILWKPAFRAGLD